MSVYYTNNRVTLYHADCLDLLPTLPDCSVDAVVTDPPYGLEFMGKEWDAPWKSGAKPWNDKPHGEDNRAPVDEMGRSTGLSRWTIARPQYVAGKGFQAWCQLWAAECLRILKPGGHLLAFGGTRTSHRLTCAVEDAGFEIRDGIADFTGGGDAKESSPQTLAWVYGSGFPKSLDVSKAIDRARDDRASVLAVTSRLAELAQAAGITRGDLDERMGTSDMGGWWLSRLQHRCACPSVENWSILRQIIPGATELDAEVWRLNGRKGTPGEAWAQRDVVGERSVPIGHAFAGATYGGDSSNQTVNETRAATPEAVRWQGWGTALKPGWEIIVVARKPLVGTVAANILQYGTGALNIDGCRIATAPDDYDHPGNDNRKQTTTAYGKFDREGRQAPPHTASRWPANVVLDSDAAAELDQQSGDRPSTGSPDRPPKSGIGTTGGYGGALGLDTQGPLYADTGGASRFFYTAKASKRERPVVDGVAHPTVKPLSLMRWLVRLVTPPGGIVLDPFAGSGPTLEAALLEGFHAIGVEREAPYLPLIKARLFRIVQLPLDFTTGEG